MDDGYGSTGSPLLDLVAARRRAQAGDVDGEAAIRPGDPDPDQPPDPQPKPQPRPQPEPQPEPQPQEKPLVRAARLRQERAAVGIGTGVLIDANGAPGRLHALHRRKTRGTAD